LIFGEKIQFREINRKTCNKVTATLPSGQFTLDLTIVLLPVVYSACDELAAFLPNTAYLYKL